MEHAELSKANISRTMQLTSSMMERREQPVSQCLIVGAIWKSSQNGQVYDPRGVSPTICAGCHSGVEPKIIVYEEDYPT